MRLTLLLAALLAPALPCQEDSAVAAQDVAAQDTVESITKDLTATRRKWMAEYRKIKDKKERSEFSRTYPRPDAFRKRMWKIVRGAEATEHGGDGLIWIVQNGARGDESRDALTLLQTHHLQHPKLGRACSRLMYDIRPVVLDFLRAVKAGSTNRDTQGIALYASAKVLQRCAGAARRIEGDDKVAKQYATAYGEDTVAALKRMEPAHIEAGAHKLLKQVVKEFGDAKIFGKPMAEKAAADIFELENLAIGRDAPDIEGEDIDGVEFKLSDYKGKVVVLDFWGDW